MSVRSHLLATLGISLVLSSCLDQEANLQQRNAPSDAVLWVSSSSDELTATLEDGDAFVLIMFKKGGPRPADFRGDPEIDSLHVFDLAMQDRNGALLHLLIGGDRLVNREWTDVMVPPPPDSTLAQRHEDILLGLELLERLEAEPEAREYRWEIDGLRVGLETTLDEVSFDGPEDLVLEPPARGTLDDILSPPSEGVLTYSHQIQIRKKGCCWNFGEHSAVLVRIYDMNNMYLGSLVTGNHGTQAADPSMSTAASCPKTYGGRVNFAPPLQPYLGSDTAWDGDAGGCNTPYGTTAAKHVCNDDSLAQFYNTKNNSSQASWVTCGDGVLRSVAPNCSL